MNRRLLVVVISVLAVGNLLASSLLGLGDAEALYYCYSRHLALSYLDHPPLIGWLIALSTAAFGTGVVPVRLVPLVMTGLAVFFTHRLTRDAFGGRAAGWAALLLLAAPVFSVGMVAAAPDAPLVALWTLFTWQLHRQLTDQRTGAWPETLRPLLLGLILGLAFLAKYTGACLVVTVLLVAADRRHRRWLRRPMFYASAALAALVASPVFIWNFENGWAGLSHRLVWTQSGAGFSLLNLGKLLGGQLLYLGPFVALIFALAVGDAIKRRRSRDDTAIHLLLAASLPALALTFLLSAWSDVAEPHWPAAGYLPLFPLAAAFVARAGRGVRRLARLTVAFGALAFIAVNVIVLTPLLPAITPEDGYDPRVDLGNELRGWPEVAETLRVLNPEGAPIIAAFYTQCGQLAFALSRPGDPPVRCISPRIDDFDLWDGPFRLTEAGAFFVSDNRFDHDLEQLLPGAASDPPITLEVTRAGRRARRFDIIHVFPNPL